MEIRWGHICESLDYKGGFVYDIHGIYREVQLEMDRPVPLPNRLMGLPPRTLVAVFQAHASEDVEDKPLKLQICDASGLPINPDVEPNVVKEHTHWLQFAPGLPLMFSQSITISEVGVPATGRRYYFTFFIGEEVIGQLPFFVTGPSSSVLAPDNTDPPGLRVDWAHLARGVQLDSGRISLIGVNEFTFLPPGKTAVIVPSASLSFLLSASPSTEPAEDVRVEFVDGSGKILKTYKARPEAFRTGVDGRVLSQVHISVRDLVMPKPDLYGFQIFAGDQRLKTLDYWTLVPPTKPSPGQ